LAVYFVECGFVIKAEKMRHDYTWPTEALTAVIPYTLVRQAYA
jgi:hypothetical protein